MRPSAQPFLRKWVLFAWEWKIISISKAKHLASFWYRGPGELENGLFRVTTIIFKYPDRVNSYIYASICYFIFLYLLQIFFYPVTFANNLFCLFRPCKQFTINIWGGAQSIKGFATLKNVVNLQFASEVRPEVVQDIFGKSKLHKLHAFMEKSLRTEMCVTIRVITGDYCSKSDSKEEDRGSGRVVCVACRRNYSESDRLLVN